MTRIEFTVDGVKIETVKSEAVSGITIAEIRFHDELSSLSCIDVTAEMYQLCPDVRQQVRKSLKTRHGFSDRVCTAVSDLAQEYRFEEEVYILVKSDKYIQICVFCGETEG